MHFLHFKCFFSHIFDVHMVVTSLFSGKWNILNHIFFLIFQQILFLELENSVIFVVRRVNFFIAGPCDSSFRDYFYGLDLNFSFAGLQSP